MKLSEADAGCYATVCSVSGIVEGTMVRVIQNLKDQPVLFYCRDSVIALGRQDCEKIEIKEGDRA